MKRRPLRLRPVRGWMTMLGLAGLLLLGCTDNRVVLNIDVASFLEPEARRGHYSAPAGSPVVEYDLEPWELRINGYDQLSGATEVTLDIEVGFDNESGRGQGRFTVFLADATDGLFASPPVAVIEAPIAPGTVSTGAATVQGDARVLELFRRQHMWVGIRLRWTPEDPAALAGDYTITRLQARVRTSVDLL